MKRFASVFLVLIATLIPVTLASPNTAAATNISARPGMFTGQHRSGRIAGADFTSTNWSGYAATGNNGDFNSITSSWTQPAVDCTALTTAYSAYWVGLDGFSSPTVEQIGTEADCARGTARYNAWYELYPANPYEVRLTLAIRSGDQLNANVKFNPATTTTNTVRGRVRTSTVPASYTLSLANNTTGKSFSATISPRQTYARSSAEVVTEAPYSGGVLPLANYSTVSYTSNLANGSPLGASANLQSITMHNPAGMLSTPSAFDSTNTAFSTIWSR